MSILSTNNKIVRVGDAYSAGSGIDITDKVISVSDDLLNEISAISATVSSVTGDIGSQIDYISGAVNDLSGDIDYISANAGRAYSGIDPIVVNNDENKISAATLQLSAGDNITLTEEGNIVRIDGQAGGGTTYTGDAQGALDEVYTNSGKWITSSFNGYIKTTGFTQGITYGTNALYFSAYRTDNPGITLYGNQGSAFYRENQLQLTRFSKKISFSVDSAGSTITADAAQTTGDGGIYLCNKNNSAYYNQNGIKLRNSASTASTAFIGYNEITSWNGYATDISYISGVVGDVETLLASL